MKLDVGMYVRTKSGLIAKYIGFKDFSYNFDGKIYWFYEYYNDYIYKEDFEEWFEKSVVKTSHNIIDLIEVGDYVNGMRIDDIDIHSKRLYREMRYDYEIIDGKEIKSIVTKEMFSNVEYRVETN